MTQGQAKKVVVLALLVGGVIAVARKARAGKWDDVPRVLVGQVIAAFFLSLLAEFKPQIAGPFALTVLAAVTLTEDIDEIVVGALRR